MNKSEIKSILFDCVAACNYFTASHLEGDEVENYKLTKLGRECAAFCKAAAISIDTTGERTLEILKISGELCGNFYSRAKELTANSGKRYLEVCKKCSEVCSTIVQKGSMSYAA